MLEENVNLIIGKMIAILNGLNEYVPDDEIKNTIPRILISIREKIDYEYSLNVLIDYKKKYLANCMSCTHPCGRTDDYSINDIEDEDIRNEKITKLNSYLAKVKIDTDFMEIVENIGSLGW